MTLTIATPPRLIGNSPSISQGDHACLIYEEDPAERVDVLLPLLTDGIAAGERCVFVSFEPQLRSLRARLEEAGVDVEHETRRGALLFWTPGQWRSRAGSPSLKRVSRVWTYIQDALTAGFSGARFVVDKAWYNDEDVESDTIRGWEATLDAMFTPDVPASLVCLYGRGVLPPETIESGLCTHPIVVLQSQVCPNPFYDAPLLLQSDSLDYLLQAPTSRTDWMLSRLQKVFEHQAGLPHMNPLGASLIDRGLFSPQLEPARH
jgi:hypothetical protein